MNRFRLRQPLERRQILALAVCIGFGLAFIIANVLSWELEDADAYWDAAMRIRAGGELYPSLSDINAPDVYRYAPWLAWLWVPLSLLPKVAVQLGWSLLLVASCVVAILPLARQRTVAAICVAALLGGLLVRTASTGNVQALLVASLVYGVPRRSGPLWIGLAASLKITPIAYALVYAGRRQWGRAVLSIAIAAALLAPALLYDLSGYPTDPGDSFSLLSLTGPAPWAAAAAAWAVIAFAMARTPMAWGAASVAVLSLIPRLELYTLTYLLVGLGGRDKSSRVTSRSASSIE